MAPLLTTTTNTDPQAAIKMSATLHSEIGRLSGNRVLMLLLQSIAHLLTELMLEAIDLGGTKEEIQDDHRALALAIVRRRK
jgi:DNA-binding FadR family transcriptional regulator